MQTDRELIEVLNIRSERLRNLGTPDAHAGAEALSCFAEIISSTQTNRRLTEQEEIDFDLGLIRQSSDQALRTIRKRCNHWALRRPL